MYFLLSRPADQLRQFFLVSIRTVQYHYVISDPTLSATVTPLMFSGKDIDPFNTFTLHCTASKPSNIIPSLQVSWYHNDLQLDNSIQGVDISEEEVNNGVEKTSGLTVSSARVLNSGAYKCRVAISIPESDEVAADQTAIVNITGMFIAL